MSPILGLFLVDDSRLSISLFSSSLSFCLSHFLLFLHSPTVLKPSQKCTACCSSFPFLSRHIIPFSSPFPLFLSLFTVFQPFPPLSVAGALVRSLLMAPLNRSYNLLLPDTRGYLCHASSYPHPHPSLFQAPPYTKFTHSPLRFPSLFFSLRVFFSLYHFHLSDYLVVH